MKSRFVAVAEIEVQVQALASVTVTVTLAPRVTCQRSVPSRVQDGI